jgi:chromate transport protein ChrA
MYCLVQLSFVYMECHFLSVDVKKHNIVAFSGAAGLQSAVEPEQAALVAQQLDEINANMQPATTTTSRLTAMFFSLLGWALVVTTILIAIAFVSYRRWRQQRSYNFDADGRMTPDTVDSLSVTNCTATSDGMADHGLTTDALANTV